MQLKWQSARFACERHRVRSPASPSKTYFSIFAPSLSHSVFSLHFSVLITKLELYTLHAHARSHVRSSLQPRSRPHSFQALLRFSLLSQTLIPCSLHLSIPSNPQPYPLLCVSGTMTFGEQNTLPQSFRLLDEAFGAGINFFDSAEMYTPLNFKPCNSFLGIITQ